MSTAEQFVDDLLSESGRPFRLRITGFPACGKTTISTLLLNRVSGACHIESESWIYPLAQRKMQDMSGAHPSGYDVARSVNEIRNFIEGKELFVSRYDHSVGDHVGGSVIVPRPDAPIILDGTLFSLSEYDDLVPACIFLRPASIEEWLQASIRRDVETRFFSEAEAIRHNMRKARDLEDVLRRSPKANVVTCTMSLKAYDYVMAPCNK